MSGNKRPLTMELIQGVIDSITSKDELENKGNGRMSLALKALELLASSQDPVSWGAMKRRTGSLHPGHVKEVLDELTKVGLIQVDDQGYAVLGNLRRPVRNYALTTEGRAFAVYTTTKLRELS